MTHTTRMGRLAALLLLLGLAAPLRAAEPVLVELTTADSLALFSVYFPAPAGTQPVALLLHDRGQSSRELLGLATTWQALGLPVFLPDLRGEGASTRSKAGRVAPAPQWNAGARAQLARDLEALLAFADHQPGLAGRPWLIAAEGEACALALDLLGGAGGARYRGALLLSPLPAPDLAPAALAAPQRLWLAVCAEDAESLPAAQALGEGGGAAGAVAAERRHLDLLDCRRRGVQLLAAAPGLPARCLEWLRAGAPPAAAAP